MKQIMEHHPGRQEIATTAYRIWEEHGKPQGRDVEFWLEAEKNLRTRLGKVAKHALAQDGAPPHRTAQEMRLIYDGE
jgi:hypothetical protein